MCMIGKHEEELLWLNGESGVNFPIYFKHAYRLNMGQYLVPVNFQLKAGGGSGHGYKFEYLGLRGKPGTEMWPGLTLHEDGTIDGTAEGSGARYGHWIKVTDDEGNSVTKEFILAIKERYIDFLLVKDRIVVPNAVYEPEIAPRMTEEEIERYGLTKEDYSAQVSNGNPITSGGTYLVNLKVNKSGCRAGKVYPTLLRVMKPGLIIHFNDNANDATGICTPEVYGEVSYVDGRFDRAINLKGTGCITVPMDDSMRISTFYGTTFECWAYLKESGRKQYIFGHSYYSSKSSPSIGFYLYYGEDGYLWINCNTSSIPKKHNTGYAMQLNKWTHIAVVVKEKSISMYADGERVFRASLSSGNIYQPTNKYSFKIGGNSDETKASDTPDKRYLWNGYIDEFMIIPRGDLYADDTYEVPDKPYNF